ncbi:MAG TPA: hypothetical protein VJ909_01175 [Prolixibacteraceae bacterium]|nr:hypothetical protein [Prolixibacteraceae bacterium]
MNAKNFSKKSVLLNDVSPFVYGTTRLGHDSIPFNERVDIAKAAMDTRIWFHASRQYGEGENGAMDALKKAFDSDRKKVPNMIVKLEGSSINEIKEDFKKNTQLLDIDSIQIGQLCLRGELAEDFANGGDSIKDLEKFRTKGWIKRYVLEVFPWTSDIALKALKNGATEGFIDGFIFYFNPLQRFVSNELWDLLIENAEPIIAMRTVAGGPVHKLRDEPGFAWKEYLHERATQIAPIFEKSGVDNWTEFCVRFAHSFAQVRATVGSTANAFNFNEYLIASEQIDPLPQKIIDDISKLQYRWSEETDMNAEPWSM